MKKLAFSLCLILILVGCKEDRLISYKSIEITYKIRGAAEGIVREKVGNYGWTWESEIYISRGNYMGYAPGKYFIFIDYKNKKGYREIRRVKKTIEKNFFEKLPEKKLKEKPSFQEVIDIYTKKLGFKMTGKKKFLNKECIVLKKTKVGSSETIYLWEKIPLNMPLYYYKVSCKRILEKKALDIKIEE